MFENFYDNDINLTNYKYQGLSFSTDDIQTLANELNKRTANKRGDNQILSIEEHSFEHFEDYDSNVIFINAHIDIPDFYNLSIDEASIQTITDKLDENMKIENLTVEINNQDQKDREWVVQFRLEFKYTPPQNSVSTTSVQIKFDVIGDK
jgi:hypothetical protein